MPRTLLQVDAALAATEEKVRQNYAGQTDMVNQATLVLNAQIQATLDAIGVVSDPTLNNQPTGIQATLLNLLSMVEDLQARVAALENPPGS
jgi:hypothetical protein